MSLPIPGGSGLGNRLDYLGMGTKSSLYKIQLLLHDLRVALLHHRVDHVDKGGGASHDHLRQALGYLAPIKSGAKMLF